MVQVCVYCGVGVCVVWCRCVCGAGVCVLWCRCVCGAGVCVLVEVGHGDPPLGLLHHVGLAPQADVDDRRCQLAGLPVHLHGDGLEGGEGDFLTLMEPLAVTTHLQRGLDTNNHRSVAELPWCWTMAGWYRKIGFSSDTK